MSNELELMKKEISSPMLQAIYTNLDSSRKRLELGVIDVKRCNVEISNEKHKIQTVALDWMYNRDIKKIHNIQTKKVK